jgi:hypothetical protein
MARIVNLDARRAARAEAAGEPPGFILGGEEFTLPLTCPLEALDLMAEARFRDAFQILLFDDADAVERVFKHRPDDADLEDIMSVYGDSGESSASAPSSGRIGKRSRRTSRATTTSTSRKPATALQPSEPAGSSPS